MSVSWARSLLLPKGRLRRQTMMLLASQTFYKLSGIFVLAVLARKLAAGDVGTFFFADSFSETFIVLASFSLNPLMMRRVAAHPDDTSRFFAPIIGFRLLSAPVYLLCVCGIAALTGKVGLFTMLAIAAATLLEDLYFVFGALFIALKRVGFNVSIGMTVQSLFLASLIAGLAWSPTLHTLLWVNLLRSALLLIVAIWVTQRWLCKVRISWDHHFVRAGMPFVLIALFAMLRDKLNPLMLGLLDSYQDVAHFELANRVIVASFFIPMAVGAVLYPELAAGGLGGDNKRKMGACAGFLAVTGMAAAGICVAIAGPAARLLYGPAAMDVAPLLRVLAITFPLAFLELFFVACLQATNRERKVVRALVVGAVVAGLAGYGMIPMWGAWGAAVAQVVGTAVRLGMMSASIYVGMGEDAEDRGLVGALGVA